MPSYVCYEDKKPLKFDLTSRKTANPTVFTPASYLKVERALFLFPLAGEEPSEAHPYEKEISLTEEFPDLLCRKEQLLELGFNNRSAQLLDFL